MGIEKMLDHFAAVHCIIHVSIGKHGSYEHMIMHPELSNPCEHLRPWDRISA